MKAQKFRCPLYKDVVRVITNPDDKAIEGKYHLQGDTTMTHAYVFRDSKTDEVILVYRLDKIDLGIVVHEVVHVVNDIFNRHHVGLDSNNDEHQAYYTQHIFNRVLERLENVFGIVK